MRGRGKVLLASVIFTALCYRVAAEILDMAPDSVDDLYSKCRNQAMDTFIHSGLLGQELNHSKGFQKAWSSGAGCSKVIPGGIKEHTTALRAYDVGDKEFIDMLNNKVKTMGGNVSTYENHFHFKSLHFLLMDYMVMQKPKNCQTVYVFSEIKYSAHKGSKVRLGRFTKAELNFDSLQKNEDLDDAVIFNITSCFFVKLGDNICVKEMIHVLLSPAEVFTVESTNKITATDSVYTEIVLKHAGVENMHSCYIFSRSPAHVSTQWPVLVLVALSLFFFNC